MKVLIDKVVVHWPRKPLRMEEAMNGGGHEESAASRTTNGKARTRARHVQSWRLILGAEVQAMQDRLHGRWRRPSTLPEPRGVLQQQFGLRRRQLFVVVRMGDFDARGSESAVPASPAATELRACDDDYVLHPLAICRPFLPSLFIHASGAATWCSHAVQPCGAATWLQPHGARAPSLTNLLPVPTRLADVRAASAHAASALR